MQRVLIITTLPEKNVNDVLDAVAAAGGGIVGEYTHCAFTSSGTGRFKPSAAANPHVGAVGEINAEPEVRVETFCARDRAKAVVQAIRKAHPYEEPVIYVVPLLEEDEL
ncbi:MAG: hypothetical protein U0694_18785 [Anaerolineae bacterium]